jgi:cobalt/nickel transport system permease protein
MISLVPLEKALWVGVFSVAFFLLAEISGFGAGRALWRAAVVLPFVLLPVLLRPWAASESWNDFLLHAIRLGIKAWTSAVILVVLVVTTPILDLCAAAERLWVPRTLTQTILLTERYFRLLRERFSMMMLSAKLRGFVFGRRREKVIGSMAGSLLLRTMDRAERVYCAMRARGYQGSIPRLTPMSFRAIDFFAAFLVLAWGLGLWWLTRLS